MTNRFATQFKKTAARGLLRQFGEAVTYYPAAGGSRSITAMVLRDELSTVPELGDVQSQSIVVRVLNDSVLGISATEIETGGDEIGVALRLGETAERRAIVRVQADSTGIVRLLLQ
jgi:hypothetical protein